MATSINADNGGLTILLQADPTRLDQTDADNHGTDLSAVRPRSPLIGEDFPDEAYTVIATILKQQQNFDLASYKSVNMKRRLAAYLRSRGCTDPLHYSDELADRAEEQKQLIAALGIHVSHFFRNPSTFLVLKSRILPEVLRMSRRQNSKLRIWSVGCALGEEPYSVALLLKDMLEKGDHFAIVGTDLSPDALKRAKNGYYPADRLKEVPAAMLAKYFSAQAQLYQINEEIRQLVQFFRHDIISEEIMCRADLILCRNLLIYFSRDKQQQVLKLLAGALSPGGYLVLGRAETLAPDCRNLFFCVDPAERIYRRTVDL
jgi:chemotaxis protein methyltransferase CheR